VKLGEGKPKRRFAPHNSTNESWQGANWEKSADGGGNMLNKILDIVHGWLASFWGWVTDDASGFFTWGLFAVAIVQVLMFYRQLRLIREDISEAKNATIVAKAAADAAKANADAVVKAERASLWPGFAFQPTKRVGGGLDYHISILNTGRAVGIIKSIHHALAKEDDFNAGRITYNVFLGRQDIVPPNQVELQYPSGVVEAVTDEPKISWALRKIAPSPDLCESDA
jgi:hypothetical protein